MSTGTGGITKRGFQPGQSGNPGGRTKAEFAFARLAREATNDGKKLIEFAVQVLEGNAGKELRDAKSRRWAADFLADRGFGKPQQHLEIGTAPDRQPVDLSGLSDEALRGLAELDRAAPKPERPVLSLVPPTADPAAGPNDGSRPA